MGKEETPRSIRLFSRDHGTTFTLANDISEDVDVLVGGRTVKKTKQHGKRRVVVAVAHRFNVDDGPDIERLRSSDGYGSRFYEAIPDDGIPRGAMSLYEMKRKHPGQYEARLQEMINRGRGRLGLMTAVGDEIEELQRKRLKEKQQPEGKTA